MSGSVVIVLPAYNEAARIGGSLDELFAYLDGSADLRERATVLVVDDGSDDGTADLVRAHPAASGADGRLAVMVVPHAGKGSAVRTGMLAATGDLIAFADADMATPPDQLPALLDALARADVALGSRIQPDGSDMRASQPVVRRALGRIFHVLAAAWVTGPVRDTQCGFKGFRREAGGVLFERQRTTGIVFDVELIFLARRLGYTIEVVPVRWFDKRGSRMHPGPGLALRVAWDLFRIPLLHRGVRRAERTV
jgi:dolichyl-phosphate beta-glucosyltransferase